MNEENAQLRQLIGDLIAWGYDILRDIVRHDVKNSMQFHRSTPKIPLQDLTARAEELGISTTEEQ